MLFHQGLGLLFDRSGLHRFAAFDPHRGLDSLGDFPGQAGVNLHRSLPKVTRPLASIIAANYISSG